MADDAIAFARRDYSPSFDGAIPLTAEQRVAILDGSDPDWANVSTTNAQGEAQVGFVPKTFLKTVGGTLLSNPSNPEQVAALRSNAETIFAWAATGQGQGARWDLAAHNRRQALRGERSITKKEWMKMQWQGVSHTVDKAAGLTKAQWIEYCDQEAFAHIFAKDADLIRAHDSDKVQPELEPGLPQVVAAVPDSASVPEPEPRVEEGEPPAAEALRAELCQLKLRALTKRAEAASVDEDLLDAAEDVATVIELIVASEMTRAAEYSAKLDDLRTELMTLKIRALTKRAEDMGVADAKLDAAESTEHIIALILEAAAGGGIPHPIAETEPEPEPVVEPTSVQESHRQRIVPTLGAHQDFHLVFSNKTNWDALCLEVRGRLAPGGVRIWQQRTNIPKDSENWFSEWYPSAIRARKIVCFISADYLKSPYCMKEWRVAESKNKLLVVACEPLSQIAAVDPSAYPQASNALAYLDGGGQVIFNGQDDIAAEIQKFL